MAHPRLALLLLVPLLLAGCTGEEDVPAAEEEPIETAATPTPAPAPTPTPVVQAPPPSSGNSSTSPNGSATPPTPPTSPTAPTPPPTPSPPATLSRPIFWNGSLHVGATLCDENSCTYADPQLAEDRHEPDIDEPLLQLNLMLGWEPASEATSTLTLLVETCDAHACAEAGRAVGTSPLFLDILDAQSRGNLRITVLPGTAVPTPQGSLTMGAPQEFSLAGVALVSTAPHDGFAGYDGDS